MLSFRSVGLLLWMGLLAGCSAEGTADEPQEPAQPDASVADASSDVTVTIPLEDARLNEDADADASDASKDAQVKDVGPEADVSPSTDGAPTTDAQADAGTNFPPTGSPCSLAAPVQERACGKCGKQSRLCDDAADSGLDAGTGRWLDWGPCRGEVPNGCTPGTTDSETCGLCGSRTRICQNNCQYALGQCSNEPPNACQPGSIDFAVGLSCDAGGRSRTCQSDCRWGLYGSCFVPEGGVSGSAVTLATAVGGKASGNFVLPQNETVNRLSWTSSCPNASIDSTATSYIYVSVLNPTAMTAYVSIWTSKSQATGAQDIDTIMATYAGGTLPTTDTARKACVNGVNDDCDGDDQNDPTACKSSWSGLFKTTSPAFDGVKIDPYDSVLVYVAAFYGSTSSSPRFGDFMLNVRTEALTP